MECNKDEAMRAKEISEKKFTAKDFTGAKKFALKAQTLYPPLEGISQMLASLDVYILAEGKGSGEPDFYGILGVSPVADDDTIKKQYRKLVLQLHPDKNKFIGAEGAFNFVSDAYNVLTDKLKRSAYNTRRHIKIAQRVPVPVPPQPQPQPHPKPQPPPGATVELKIPVPKPATTRKPYKTRKQQQKGAAQTQTQEVRAQSVFEGGETFWTVCTRCNMKYEYMRNFLRQVLTCPECKAGFLAVEIKAPLCMPPLRPRGGAGSPTFERPSKKAREANGVSSSKWRPEVSTTTF